MISKAFISGDKIISDESHLIQVFESATTNIMNEFLEFRSSLFFENAASSLESTIMGGEYLTEAEKKEEEVKQGVLERIGKAVMEIFKKFSDLIDNLIDRIKNIGFSKKTDIQKLDKLIKVHPNLKDEILCSFKEGSLDITDIRSLSELDKTFDEIVKLSKKKDTDSSTLKGKWEKAKKKYLNIETAKNVTIIVTAILAVRKFTSDCAKAKNILERDKAEMQKRRDNIMSQLNEENVITDKSGLMETKLAIWRELNGYHAKAAGLVSTNLSKITDSIAAFIDKHVISDTKREESKINRDIILNRKNSGN